MSGEPQALLDGGWAIGGDSHHPLGTKERRSLRLVNGPDMNLLDTPSLELLEKTVSELLLVCLQAYSINSEAADGSGNLRRRRPPFP